MFNHKLTARPADRTFRHFFPLKGRIHVVEVHRKEGLYTAKAFLGPEYYTKEKHGREGMHYPVVAISMGFGFSSLRDAFRSLRKDMALDAWSRACLQARARTVIAEGSTITSRPAASSHP